MDIQTGRPFWILIGLFYNVCLSVYFAYYQRLSLFSFFYQYIYVTVGLTEVSA